MPKKKKGKKKSKEELEAERKAREEEEERLRQEELRRQEEERKRLEEERRQREEAERKRRAAELAQLQAEHEEDASTEAARAERLEAITKEAADKEEWAKYLACSHRPDPSRETDMNTFLSEQRGVDDPELGSALETCEYTTQIVKELDDVEALAVEAGDSDRVAVCGAFRARLFDLVTDKQDRATAAWLQNARSYAKRATPFEAKTWKQVGDLKYGLWVNLGLKNIRVKHIPFDDLGIIIDITKPLAVQRVAFRVVHHQFDDAETRAKRVKETARAFEGMSEFADTSARPSTRAARGGRGKAGAGGAGAGAGAAGGDAESKGVDVEGVEPTVPRDYSLGGVVYVEMLALPGQPKSVNKWTLHQLTPLSTGVLRQQHPMRLQTGAAASAQAVKVKYTLPDYVIVRDEVPRVAFWDAEAGKWSQEQIAEVTYNRETRLVGFHTVELTGFAVIQARHIDFPYSNWALHPTGPDTAQLTLTTPRFVVDIEVSGKQCRLRGPTDVPELEGLMGVGMSPAQLLQALKRCGINLMPVTDDASHVAFENGSAPVVKSDDVERRTYDDISKLAAAFSATYSRWNQEAGEDKCVVRLKETLDLDEAAEDVHETDWRCVAFECDEESASGFKSLLIAARESHTAFKSAAAPLQTQHRSVRRTLQSRSTPEALEVAAASSPLFQLTVSHLLWLVRPLSFC